MDESKVRAFVERDYHEISNRKCHQCSKLFITTDDLVKLLVGRSVIVQSLTGRLFCNPECFEQYKKDEGL